MKILFILFFIFSTNFCIGSIKRAKSLQNNNKKNIIPLNKVQHIKRRSSFYNVFKSKSTKVDLRQKNYNPKIMKNLEYEQIITQNQYGQHNTIDRQKLKNKIEPYISIETMDTHQRNILTMIQPDNALKSQNNSFYLKEQETLNKRDVIQLSNDLKNGTRNQISSIGKALKLSSNTSQVSIGDIWKEESMLSIFEKNLAALNNVHMIEEVSMKLSLNDQEKNAFLQFLQMNMNRLKMTKTEVDGFITYNIYYDFATIHNAHKTPSFRSKKSSDSSTNSKEIIKLQEKQIEALRNERNNQLDRNNKLEKVIEIQKQMIELENKTEIQQQRIELEKDIEIQKQMIKIEQNTENSDNTLIDIQYGNKHDITKTNYKTKKFKDKGNKTCFSMLSCIGNSKSG